MSRVNKHAKEAQLQQIFRMMLGNKTHEEIAKELNIATKTVYRYSLEIDKRYGEAQRQKTEDTLFTECQLFKHRMLTLYKGLELIVTGLGHSGTEKAKCAEIAANIAIDVLKMESEGIRAVKELGIGDIGGGISYYGKGNRLLNDIQQQQEQQQQQQQSTTTGTATTTTTTTGTKATISDMVPRELDDQEETC